MHLTKVAAGGDGGGGGVAPIEAAPGDNGTLVWQSSSRDTDAASLHLVLGLEARRPGTHAEAKALVPPPEGRPAKPTAVHARWRRPKREDVASAGVAAAAAQQEQRGGGGPGSALPKWLGSGREDWPLGETAFEVSFEVTRPEAAALSLPYSADSGVVGATLNGRPIDIGEAPPAPYEPYEVFGDACTIRARGAAQGFLKGENVLRVTVTNAQAAAPPRPAPDGSGPAEPQGKHSLSYRMSRTSFVRAFSSLSNVSGDGAPADPPAAAPTAFAAPGGEFSIDLTTGLEEWYSSRNLLAHFRDTAGARQAWRVRSEGEAAATATEAAISRHPPTAWHVPSEGHWLDGGEGAYRKVFSVQFSLTEAQAAAAELAFAYAVDDTLEQVILNGWHVLQAGQKQGDGFSECGGTQVVRALRGAGLFIAGINVLELHVHNSGGQGGVYVLGGVSGTATPPPTASTGGGLSRMGFYAAGGVNLAAAAEPAAAQPALQVKLRAERPAADPEFPRREVIQPAQQRLWENDPNGSRTHLLDLANKSTSRSYMKDRGGGLFVFVEDSVGGERPSSVARRHASRAPPTPQPGSGHGQGVQPLRGRM